jgi:ATP-dependent RNA helicase RhlE
MSFSDLPLSPPLRDALADMALQEATPIQTKAFPVILSGRDVVGIAQTGTGKTFAYLLPILRNLAFSKQKEPRVLILVPTRELVVQVAGEIEKLTRYMTVRTEGIYGGTNINTQKLTVSAGLDVLVATPGRLVDLVLIRAVSLKGVRQLVIDEVDEMLNLGFRGQLTQILELLPARRQNLLFSATMTEEVDELINTFFNNPALIEIVRAGTPLERIVQHAYEVANFHTKLNLLSHLLAQDAGMSKVLIFGASKRMADKIHEHLSAKFRDQFAIIHSNKSQNYRLGAVQQFEAGERRGLIATDILARGIDVSDVTHVVNVDVPTEPERYIHRIGRTGRADRDGAALVFYTEAELEAVGAIETLMGREIPRLPFPDDVPVSNVLTEEERPVKAGDKNYLPDAGRRTGAFHEKKDKNKKVNLGNKAKHLREQKYKKPIKKKR